MRPSRSLALVVCVSSLACTEIPPAGDAMAALEAPKLQALYETDFNAHGDRWFFNPASSLTYSTYTPVPGVVCYCGPTACAAGGWSQAPGSWPPSSFGRAGCQIAFHDQQSWWAAQGPDHYLESRAPWWIDGNHFWYPQQETPGFGFINLIAFKAVQPYMDLTGVTVRFRLRTVGLQLRTVAAGDGTEVEREGHLYFWFETKPLRESDHDDCDEGVTHPAPGACKNFDYILEAQPLDTPQAAAGWTEVSLTLTPEAGWRCLGASRDNQRRYGCLDDVGRGLPWAVGIGFVVAPVQSDPNDDSPSGRSNRGSILFDDFRIYAPGTSGPTVVPALRSAPDDSPLPIRPYNP